MTENYSLLKPGYPKWVGSLSPKVKIFGRILQFTAVVWTFVLYVQSKDNLYRWYAIAGIVFLWLLSWVCIHIDRRLAVIKEQYRTLENFPPEVLYLRSFRDDKGLSKIPRSGGDSKLLHLLFGNKLYTDFMTGEDIIARQLKMIGKPVAIGESGEILPPLGVPRLYIADEHWREQVEKIMKSVKLVVIRADVTNGLLKEFTMAATNVLPENLIVLLPSEWNAKDYNEFRAKVKHIARFAELPDIFFPENEPSPNNLLLYFDNQWKAKYSYRELEQFYVERS